MDRFVTLGVGMLEADDLTPSGSGELRLTRFLSGTLLVFFLFVVLAPLARDDAGAFFSFLVRGVTSPDAADDELLPARVRFSGSERRETRDRSPRLAGFTDKEDTFCGGGAIFGLLEEDEEADRPNEPDAASAAATAACTASRSTEILPEDVDHERGRRAAPASWAAPIMGGAPLLLASSLSTPISLRKSSRPTESPPAAAAATSSMAPANSEI